MPINKKLEKQFIVYSYDRPHNKRELIHTKRRNLTNTMLKKTNKKESLLFHLYRVQEQT